MTGKCNPSHSLIALETGVEISGVSVAKKELRTKGWIETRGKRDVIVLIGVGEFEKAREAYLWKIQISQASKFGKSKDDGATRGAIFGKSKDAAPDLGFIQGTSLDFPKIHNKDEIDVERDVAAAATPTPISSNPNSWKQEPVTQDFLDELVTRGLFSRDVVMQSWQELAFAVAQRGPSTVAVKGELLAFCRAKQRSGFLPGVVAAVVKGEFRKEPGSAVASRKCSPMCSRCFGTGLEVVQGKGARRCPNTPPGNQSEGKKGTAEGSS